MSLEPPPADPGPEPAPASVPIEPAPVPVDAASTYSESHFGPSALATPANVLLGQSPVGLPAALLAAMAAGLLALATLTFKKGLKHYATTGSVRYSNRGFRS